jgi:hypothetical protein
MGIRARKGLARIQRRQEPRDGGRRPLPWIIGAADVAFCRAPIVQNANHYNSG